MNKDAIEALDVIEDFSSWNEKEQSIRHSEVQTAIQTIRAALERPQVDVIEAINKVIGLSYSHVDGRDLFAELKPRKTLDIKKRKDGIETWHEGDWLTDLGDAVRELEALNKGYSIPPNTHENDSSHAELQDFACKVSDFIWGGELGWAHENGLNNLFEELKKRLTTPDTCKEKAKNFTHNDEHAKEIVKIDDDTIAVKREDVSEPYFSALEDAKKISASKHTVIRDAAKKHAALLADKGE